MYRKTLLLTLLSFIGIISAAASDSISYLPQVHGVVRTRWEIETQSGESRFQVRHARVALQGNAAPFLSYYVHADFCDKGTIKFLDGYATLKPLKGLALQAGQFRMPFGVETFRSPMNYYFSNKSFMQKDMCNMRRVGALAQYIVPIKKYPLTLEAGAFNNASTADHAKWSKYYAFSGKATWQLGQFKLSGGAMGVRPENTRLYMYDAALTWGNRNFYAAAEYMNQHYAGNVYKDAHSYVAFLDYHREVNKKLFNQWSVQARFDGITDFWNGISADALQPARNRITVGGTLTWKYKFVMADFKVNYEKYFYHKNVTAPEGLGDKVVVELVARF